MQHVLKVHASFRASGLGFEIGAGYALTDDHLRTLTFGLSRREPRHAVDASGDDQPTPCQPADWRRRVRGAPDLYAAASSPRAA